ncbi:MAG: methyl-accepting chemotaxis protein [Syntrophales bacterium]
MSTSNLQLGTRLSLGFAAVLILLVIMAYLGINRLGMINDNLDQIVDNDNRKVAWANDIIQQVDIIAIATRNLALSRDPEFIQKEKERIETARTKYKEDFDRLTNTLKSEQGKALLKEINELTIQLKSLNNRVMELGLAMQGEEVAKLVTQDLEPIQKKLNAAIESLIRYQEEKTAQSVKSAARAYASARLFLILIGSAAIVLGGLIAFFLTRSITRPINRIIEALTEGADQVTCASDQVSSASRALAQGAQQQAASVEETSSSLEEMSSMTKTNADNAGEANSIIKTSLRDMEEANKVMADLIASMEEISSESEKTQAIVKTIDEIAFQTNLLALNAAVEAARAGEAGAGFAVVAEEVRNLAMRAADAARNTTGLIETTVSKIKQGTLLAGKTHEAFEKVTDGAVKIGQLVGDIAAASHEQAQGIEQVNRAVAEVDKVIQQNAAQAEESSAASEQMNAQSRKMKNLVRELISLVRGKKDTYSPLFRKSSIPAFKEITPGQVIPLQHKESGGF